jgi:adenylosuccinate lyase
MIDRYALPDMARLWQPESRFSFMLEVELAVADAQAESGIIPRRVARVLRRRAKFDVAGIEALEKTLKHDVIAFVKNVASYVGPEGRYLHYGLTSSDVLDTASALQLRAAITLLLSVVGDLKKTLKGRVRRHGAELCAGRTHGMQAEPTTFGFKLAGHLAEVDRAQDRLRRAREIISTCKLSGAVGTFSAQPPAIEARVARRLKLRPETVATQVIPRDRHLDVMHAVAGMGVALERLAIELRHLQRTEVAEVIEGFTPGQRGSSAMPHKKNPISAENLTGVSRLLKSYVQAAYDNVALWHERDISHSAVERVIWPDAFCLIHYAVVRMDNLLKGMHVDAQRMLDNLHLSGGTIFSSHALLLLVYKGLSRDEAYEIVQQAAHSLQRGEQLRDVLGRDKRLRKLVSEQDLDRVFSGQSHRRAIAKALSKVLREMSK